MPFGAGVVVGVAVGMNALNKDEYGLDLGEGPLRKKDY